jgi:hypothetical protein
LPKLSTERHIADDAPGDTREAGTGIVVGGQLRKARSIKVD